MVTKKEIGSLLKEARKIKSKEIGKKYTQKMLANDIKKSQSYIGDIESGRTYPSIVTLSKISKACELNFDFFETPEKLNTAIEKFIKLNIGDIEVERLHKMREEIKNDSDTKIDYIYDFIKNSNSYTTEKFSLNDLLINTDDVIKFILKNPAIIALCEFDINKLNKSELSGFSKDIVSAIKLISYKYKK